MAAKTRKRKCLICQDLFEPDARTRHGRRYRQRTCSKTPCQRERKQRYWRRLMASRPKSLKRHKEQTRLWAQARGYWKYWRKDHCRYVARDNERRRLAHIKAKRAAKQVQIKRLRADRIEHLRQMLAKAQCAAKQVQILPVVAGLVDYLYDRDCAAKQVYIEAGIGPAG